METTIIRGGYLIPSRDSHLGAWQLTSDRLDHDRFLPSLVCSHISAGQFVIDGGAYNGDHTIAYSQAVHPVLDTGLISEGMVIAVEAGPVFELLKHNVALFPHKNVFAIHGCLGERDGETVSHVMADTNFGASICEEKKQEELIEGQKYLKTVTIDYLVHESKPRTLDFLKLDIEGFELKALLGASKTLRDHRPKMLIEINPGALAKQQDTPEDIFELLSAFRYNWSIVQPECTAASPQFDILCLPETIMRDDPSLNGTLFYH